jgi:hypothetical protein
LVDLYQTGRQDMLSGSYPGEIYLFRQKPNRTYASAVKLKDKHGKVINVGRAAAVALGDLHGKGTLDLVVGNIDGKVFLLPNEGTPSQPAFGPPQRLEAAGRPVIAAGGDAGPCLADWDGDGRLDLLVGSAAGTVVWYRNVGSTSQPQLAAPVTLVEAPPQGETGRDSSTHPTRSGMRTKVAVGDWNHDGRPDLLVGDVAWFGEGPQTRTHGWVWVYLRKPASVAQQTDP